MRVLVVTAQVPFVRGGAEILAEGLHAALGRAGHQAEVVRLPFKWYPASAIPPQVLGARLMDMSAFSGTDVDLVIGLKFPAYLVPHPRKSLWILHQHRAAYDFWDAGLSDLAQEPGGRVVRDFIRRADDDFLPEARRIYTISRNVSDRLARFNGIASEALYHPPAGAEHYTSGPYGDYVLFPSRIDAVKRQWLAIDALAHCELPVSLVLVGDADNARELGPLKARARERGVDDRVHWAGAVREHEKRRLYANACAVVYPPLDEDYGYVTLEAMLAARPVITCSDSGGPLEFVRHEMTGLVVEPTALGLAKGMDRLWRNREEAGEMGRCGRRLYDELNIGWDEVVARLCEVNE
jgi:glycosyltransferase involved in cell wall biosynthesis